MNNSTHLSIITGSSRGLGAELAMQCLRKGHTVIGIARSTSDELDAVAARYSANLHQWRHDLADPESAAWPLLEWLQAQTGARYLSATLINNAGVLAPLGPLADINPEDTARTLRVGLEAPMVLTSMFLRGTREWLLRRKVLNISSGLGRRAMAGSASYCAAKAGLDHFSRALALEEAGKPNGAAIVSLAPGVIDTEMQAQLRNADPTQFADQPAFAQLHAQNQLLSTEEAARRVLAWLEREDFGQNPVADVRSA
jgi:benzil reductase ((S)-benzoin forming)